MGLAIFLIKQHLRGSLLGIGTSDDDHVSNCDHGIRVNYDYDVTLELGLSHKITLE